MPYLVTNCANPKNLFWLTMTEEVKKHFLCKHVGYDCDWKLKGESEDVMLPIIEAHAAEVHVLSGLYVAIN
jgi:predicted small metal-binding protein